MPQKTKLEDDCQKCIEDKAENPSVENSEIEQKGNWSEDQKSKSYYYDDSYGYEVYNPDDEDDAEESFSPECNFIKLILDANECLI